jgi:tRNA-specific 2-thiouridylase
MHEFLGQFIDLKRGDLLNGRGDKIGEHDGAALYTIGQRHGFSISAGKAAGPYYVSAVDTKRNTVEVSSDRRTLEHTKCEVTDLHWIAGDEKHFDAVPRYHGKSVHAHLEGEKNTTYVTFDHPLPLTPGQSLVFYDRDRCLGGAVIQRVGDQR